MIEGVVRDLNLAIVPLEVLGAGSQRQIIETVIDTGFTGELTLPGKVIHAMGMLSIGTRRAELANGVVVEFDLYAARVMWHGKERDVSALDADAGTLIGMALLEDSRLTIDVVADGRVSIAPIVPAA